MPTTCSLLLLGGVLIGGNSTEDAAAIQGTLRASYPYPDGDARGGQPSAAATAALAAAAAYTAESAAGSPHTTFGGVTYCQFDPNITETQQWRFEPIGEGVLVGVCVRDACRVHRIACRVQHCSHLRHRCIDLAPEAELVEIGHAAAGTECPD